MPHGKGAEPMSDLAKRPVPKAFFAASGTIRDQSGRGRHRTIVPAS
jgi:hypothetical protein